jgi:hypothetical protein
MDLERVWVAQKQWKRLDHRPPSAQQAKGAGGKGPTHEDKAAVRLACLLRLEMSFFADGLLHYIQVRDTVTAASRSVPRSDDDTNARVCAGVR